MSGDSTRNSAEKYAVRCCHFTHQFIVGGKLNPRQFIAVNPKESCVGVTMFF